MMSRCATKGEGPFSLEWLPLFAADDLLGAALLGAGRVTEWRHLAPILEGQGLPKVDHTMGGRYVPAVKAFFDHRYGLNRGAAPPLAPDGAEDFGKWRNKQKHRS